MHGQAAELRAEGRTVTAPADEHARLIQAVAVDRDRAAFSQLFEYFAPRLKAYLMRAGAPAAAAEDFAQNAMLTVWRKADLFDPSRAGAATWIFTIARNSRLDGLRREARQAALPDFELAPEAPERPDELLSGAEEAARLTTAMRELSPDEVTVLRLAFFKGDAHSEIARALDLPLGTVKSRIRKAMIKLRHRLEPTRGAQ